METTEPHTYRAGIIVGIIFVILGIVASVITALASVTSLIPVVIGALFLIVGIAGHQFDQTRAATYGLVILSVATIIGSVQGLIKLVDIAQGAALSVAPISQSIMVIIAIALLVIIISEWSDVSR